jgi:hypothetical protein
MLLPFVACGQTSQFVFDAPGNLLVESSEIIVVPRILGQPQNQIVIPGDSASFSVVVADTRSLSYQWRFNGTDVPGATSDSLLLTNVSAANEGVYSAFLSNGSGSVLSDPAFLYIDSNGNGLPDSWEIAHFGNLGQTATGDFDHDGVSNLQEFLDGTNPANAASVFYHLTLINNGGGTVMVVPDQHAYTNGATVTLTAIASSAEPFHAWTGDILNRSNTLTVTMNGNKTLLANFAAIPFVWTNINGGDWNVAMNWSPNLVPGSNDSVLIQISSPVTLDTDAACTDVSIGGPGMSPTLTGTGALTVRGTLLWSSGTLSGSGRTIVEPRGTFVIDLPNQGFTDSRTFELGGTTFWTGTGNVILNNVVITNRPGALFEAQSSGGFFGPSRFDNAGIFHKSTGNTTAFANLASFNNFNIAHVEFGTLSLGGGGTNTGNITIEAGATVNVANGTFISSPGSSMMGGCEFIFSGGTANFAGNWLCTNNTFTFSGGTANFDGTGTVAPPVINLINGVLGGAQTVTVGSSMNWTGGAMNGTGRTIIPPGVTLNLSIPSFASMSSRTLENGGTTIWTGPGSIMMNDAVITNRPGALFDAQNASMMNFGGGAPRFDNAGTLRKSISSGSTSFNSVAFNNYNDVEIQTGTLSLLGGGLNNGTINVPAGTALELGGVFNSSASSSISGTGQFTATFGTVTLAGLVNVTGSNFFANGTANLTGNYFCTNQTMTISGATANFDGTGIVAPSVINLSGALGGAQTVRVGNMMNWTGGSLIGSGRTVISAGATLHMGANPLFMTSRTLDNAGTTVYAGPSLSMNDAVITNEPGALFQVQNPSPFFFGGGSPRVDNAGTFQTTGAGTTFVGAGFNNYNVAQLQGGTLQLSSGGLNSGSIAVPAGAALELGGVFSSTPGSSIAGAGQFTVNGGTANLAGLVNVTGTNTFSNGIANFTGNYFCTNNPLIISGGTANFDGTGLVTPPVVNLSGGALGGAQTVTVENVMNWTGGSMIGSGRTVIPPGTTLYVGGPTFLPLTSRTLDNGGTAIWTGAGNIFLMDAVITNRPGGLFNAQNAALFSFAGGAPRFDNAGTFRKSSNTGTTSVSGLPFNNYGVVELQSGILQTFSGYFSVSNSTLRSAIGGTNAGTGFGQLQVVGSVTVNGGLGVALATGFTPALNDSFAIVTAGSRSGAFTSFSYPSNMVTMQLNHTTNSVIVQVTAVANPPPLLFPPLVSGTNVTLTWMAVSNLTYRLEFNPNLTPSNWSALVGDVISISNLASKVDSLTPTNRFYRVRVVP